MNSQHGRTQSLLLIQKLLDCKDSTSPFILALDSIQQSARPLIHEYVRRARNHQTKVIFAAFETLRPPTGIDKAISAFELDPKALTETIFSSIKSISSSSQPRCLIIFDSLLYLASHEDVDLPAYLASLIVANVTVLAIYHLDQPISHFNICPYSPSPLTLLKYLATTVLNVHSFAHVLDDKLASDRSLAPPLHGLGERKEGIIQGLGSCDTRGLVIEMEHRRKSGRSVTGLYFLPIYPAGENAPNARHRSQISLLTDHPLYSDSLKDFQSKGEDDLANVTFSLGLTDKQRRDREDVVLPYYDAQGGAGLGGGRILYDMGAEDDFDEEEDEI